MPRVNPLRPEDLQRHCAAEEFTFKTSEELEDLAEVVGQARAMAAVEFGVGIRKRGYNLFAIGPSGIGKLSTLQRYLKQRAGAEPVAADWCYTNNFQQPHRPHVIRLPAGVGAKLKRDAERLVEELRSLIPTAFESEDYQARRRTLEEEYKELQERALEEIQRMAGERHIALVKTPGGFAFAPAKGDEVLPPEEYERLGDPEKERVSRDIEMLQEALQAVIGRIPQLNREARERLKMLNRQVTTNAVEHVLDELRASYKDFPDVLHFFEEVEQDVVENFEDFLRKDERAMEGLMGLAALGGEGVMGPRSYRRYHVNLLIDHSASQGAPVVYEDNPTMPNLIGRAEHMAQMGALITDFNMIRAGALHRANGGYLLLDARNVLTQPLAWEELKRVLKSGEIRIESPGQMLSIVSTVSLEPQAIPLDVKIILIGEPLIYYLLYEHDPDFGELFKVVADFTEEMSRSAENDVLYARLVSTLVRREKLRPFGADAIARIIEQAARRVGDAEKISTSLRQLTDLLVESDYWAGATGRAVVSAADVKHALEARIHRSDRLRERMQEEIVRGTLLIDTAGATVGQVNGLSVVALGGFTFGRPIRITARVWPGSGEVIDIEREVELAGPIHSKGVMILTGFLGERYARRSPLALTATLVFEQSYGEIEGDSASSTELYALLSALADLPIKQTLAVTGSVDQHGRIQAIGGVNEKIEGFFDLCRARGLSGEHGVLIPASNVKNLMLRDEVLEAVRAGQFKVFSVSTIDEGIELLTGVPAGKADADGRYPEGTVNRRVANTLRSYTETAEWLTQRKSKRPVHDLVSAAVADDDAEAGPTPP